MKDILDFLIKAEDLKKMPRRGWVINQIENPESIAEHIFRAVIMAWILGKKKGGFNLEKLFKIALIHDLCEVYAGDTTPYDSILPKDKEELKKLMKTWPRLSPKEKRRNFQEKHEKEKKALEMLISDLPKDLGKEIMGLWMDYEKKVSPEGRFFNQADRMENFLQAYEYWEKYKNPPLSPWWLWAREFFDDPLLLEFMVVLEIRFHGQKIPKELEASFNLLDFFNKIGTLKRKPREGLTAYQMGNFETVAEHIYQLALLSWILGTVKRNINLEKIVKMVLVHGLGKVNSEDISVHGPLSTGDREKISKKELTGLKRLTSNLPIDIAGEIEDIWVEFEEGSTPEAGFVKQCDNIANLLQSLQYRRNDHKVEHDVWMKWIKKETKDPELLNFLEAIKEKSNK